MNTVFLLDVDNTLVAAELQSSVGIVYNEPLIQALASQAKDAEFVLMTAWQAFHNLKHNVRQSTTRDEVLVVLQQYGINCRATIITASPFEEGKQPEQFGQYYRQSIQPLERQAQGKTPEQVEALMKEHSKLIEGEQQSLKDNARKGCYQQEQYQNGKEEMIRHIIHYYQSIQPEIKRFIVLDDNRNVLNTAQAIAREEVLTQHHTQLFGIHVCLRDSRQDKAYFSQRFENPELPELPPLPSEVPVAQARVRKPSTPASPKREGSSKRNSCSII